MGDHHNIHPATLLKRKFTDKETDKSPLKEREFPENVYDKSRDYSDIDMELINLPKNVFNAFNTGVWCGYVCM